MVAIILLMLLVAMTVGNLRLILMRNAFRAQVHDFVTLMEQAGISASQSDRRYEVIIDMVEQTYMLREITSPDLAEVLEEEIIATGEFGEDCYVEYVLFDDGEFADDTSVKFRAGKSGWQYGGAIVMVDEDEMFHSIVVNRLGNIISVEPGEAAIMYPLSQEDLPF
jgi:hypothetical protein